MKLRFNLCLLCKENLVITHRKWPPNHNRHQEHQRLPNHQLPTANEQAREYPRCCPRDEDTCKRRDNSECNDCISQESGNHWCYKEWHCQNRIQDNRDTEKHWFINIENSR